VRLLSSMRNNTIIMWGSACNLIVNISLNYLLMQWLGIVGIALSTSFVYLFSFVFLLFFLLKDLRAVEQMELATKNIESKLDS
jgi:putative peptidoglycan lipid II flippase